MATLDDIVAATAKVFRTKGYHAATIRDIADEVGILKGSLYHRLASKEELLYLVVKEPIAQMSRTRARSRRARGQRPTSFAKRSAPTSWHSTTIFRIFSSIEPSRICQSQFFLCHAALVRPPVCA